MAKRKIHVAKAVSWRIIASLTTFVIAWIVTGELEAGLIIGGIEAFAKMFFYYFHERAWYRFEESGKDIPIKTPKILKSKK